VCPPLADDAVGSFFQVDGFQKRVAARRLPFMAWPKTVAVPPLFAVRRRLLPAPRTQPLRKRLEKSAAVVLRVVSRSKSFGGGLDGIKGDATLQGIIESQLLRPYGRRIVVGGGPRLSQPRSPQNSQQGVCTLLPFLLLPRGRPRRGRRPRGGSGASLSNGDPR
jgi:hypothetical protein